jgi:carnitine O-acetyltransferase
MNKYEPEMDKTRKSRNTLKAAGTPPLLPLPSLKDTADCFTRWFTPFLTNEQRAQTRAALNAFIKPDGLGVLLHERLQTSHNQNKQSCWLDEYWVTRFLARREPIVRSGSFFFLFRQGELDRTRHAATLIAGALNYKLVLDQGHVPLAVERTLPTCVNQITNLFGNTRIPGETLDTLLSPPINDKTKSSASRHIVVFLRGNLFQLDLISASGQPHALMDIEKGLREIVDHCFDVQAAGRSVGYLTTLQRSDWARTRVSLMQGSNNNADNLAIIESALFTVHLEDFEPADNRVACDEILRGNGANRWFDKSLQFIIFENGYAGLNIEHSGLDRAGIVDFLDYILGIDPNSIDQYSGAARQGLPAFKELAFDLPPTFQKKIARAATAYESLRSSLTSQTIEFNDYHAKLLAQKRVSPDALVHCALQLAHFRLTQKLAAANQNISMRHFAFGRVQSIWTLSSEMIDFVAIMLDEKKSDTDRFKALQYAAVQHEKSIVASREGEVPEQHITELLNIYKRHPEEFQADFLSRLTSGGLSPQDIDNALSLFTSDGWTSMKKNAFTTSFLASPTLVHHGFYAADRDNIAASCLIHNEVINLYLCAGKSHKKLIDPLAAGWHQAITELHDLLGMNLDVSHINLAD